MERPIAGFVRALRAADLRISTAETLDALRVAELVGWPRREQLKDALRATLAKDATDDAAFDACFDQFFDFDAFSSGDAAAEATDDGEDSDTSENKPNAANDASSTEPSADQADGQAGEPGGGEGRGGQDSDAATDATDRSSEASGADSVHAAAAPIDAPDSPLGQMLMADNRSALSVAMARAAHDSRLEQIKVFTQQGLYTRRILDAMGRAELMDEITALRPSPSPPAQRLGEELRQRYERLRAQTRDYVEQQFLLHADAQGERLRETMLRSARLGNVARHNDYLIRRAIERMARQLIAAHSRKRRVTKRGALDVPRMIRKNMRHDANMIELAWRSKRIDKPRIFAVCDVSGSVAPYARFMLMFLYSLQDVLPKVRAFAFCSNLAEVTDLFKQQDLDEATRRTLAEHGNGSTDYGHAFADFQAAALDDVDRRSTVLILGDARNNDANPRTDLLRKIYTRSRRVVWLNPEPQVSWDTGDSVMGRYRAHCHQVRECGSLIQLERVISDLVRQVT